MALADALATSGHSPGDLKLYGGVLASLTGIQEPRRGFLLANGAAVSRTTYARLFALYSTRYGAGDGSTTFNLPNYLDRAMVFKGPTKATVGAAAGALGHTHTVASHHHSVPSHSHTLASHTHDLSSHTHTYALGVNSGGSTTGIAGSAVQTGGVGHGHVGGTNGPDTTLTGGPSTGSDPNSAQTSDAAAGTGAADPPFVVVGAKLVRY